MEAKTVDCTTFREYKGNFMTPNNEDDPFCQDASRSELYDKSEVNYRREGRTAADYFGTALEKNGFECLGTDEMYCGMFGEPMEVRIFLGCVYYQRLRHMVNDKAQVRATGPIDQLTRQPVKGRKRHGGIRFGEMERDSLLAHGTSFLLHDRLMRSSDYAIVQVCQSCGSMLSPMRMQGQQTGLPRPQRTSLSYESYYHQ